LLLELGIKSRAGICDEQRNFVRYYYADDKQAAILLARALDTIMPGIGIDFYKAEIFVEETLYVCIYK